MPKIIVVLSFLLVVFLADCSNQNKSNEPAQETIRTEKEEMFRDFVRNGALIVYNSNLDSLKNHMYSNFRFFRNSLKDKMKFVASSDISETQLKESNLIIIGTPDSNKVLQKIAGTIPLKFTKNGFVFDSIEYSNPKDIVHLMYYNPFNRSKLCYVISGNNETEILKNINLERVGDVRVSKSYETLALGFFKLDERNNWVLNDSLSRNYFKQEKIINPRDHFIYTIHDRNITPALINKIKQIDHEGYEKLKSFVGVNLNSNNIKVHLYSTFEEKGLITDNTDLSNFIDSDSSIHIVVNNWINGDDFSKIAAFLLSSNLGKSKLDFMNKGFGIYFSNKWGNEGYKFWASKLYLSGNVPPLDSLLNNNTLNYISRFVYEPLSGTFIDFLLSKYGKEKFLYFYKNWKGNKEEIKNFSAEWTNYLHNLSQDFSEKIKGYASSFPAVKDSFLKGVCFAHVGYQIYNGYLSQDAFESLQKTKELGVNSFSITPFTSMREKHKPEHLRFWEFSGAENDESLIYLEHVSEVLGMSVMMKPHVYLGANSWPGDIKMNDEKDWNLFFHYYYDWIFHYAMLSEIYKIPLLCIGNELAQATIGHENEWEALISKIRSFYDGKITYAANWGGEFEGIKFWDKLDFIGLSEYYPLSFKDNPTHQELLEGAEKVMNKIHDVSSKYNKMVIFTEVGFRASAKPWKTSEEGESDRKEINFESQERCYQAIFEAAYDQKWLKGMYWWKWPSYLQYNGINADEPHDLYSPNNRPAQNVMRDWYSRKWN